jgi:hypothetical protein
MAMAAMNMVSAGGFSGVSFHLRRFPQGVASVFCKKTPIFGSRGSKLDHLTVLSCRMQAKARMLVLMRHLFLMVGESLRLKMKRQKKNTLASSSAILLVPLGKFSLHPSENPDQHTINTTG